MIKDSARRHGVADKDMRHAIRQAVRVWQIDGGEMIVGPATNGTLIEVGVNSDGEIFHAMAARPKYL